MVKLSGNPSSVIRSEALCSSDEQRGTSQFLLDEREHLIGADAIDDVGTGYSSLHSITEIQPDFLKIDISLIKNVHQSLIKQHLVQSLLQVGARIGAQVIAEGIESEEECRTLRALGVRYGQGYYFARPAPPFPALERRGPGMA